MIYKNFYSIAKHMCLGVLISGLLITPVALEAKKSKIKRIVNAQNIFIVGVAVAFIIFRALTDTKTPKQRPTKPKQEEQKCGVCLETPSEAPTKKFIPLPCCDLKQVLCNKCLPGFKAGSPCPYCRTPLAADLFQANHIPEAKNVPRPDADIQNGTDRATQDLVRQLNEDILPWQNRNHMPQNDQGIDDFNDLDAIFRNIFGAW